MASNYPPGVSGNEPQINGDAEWEKLMEWLADSGLLAEEIRLAVKRYLQSPKPSLRKKAKRIESTES